MYKCIYVYMYINTIHSVICIYTCIFIHIYIRNLYIYIYTHINDKHRCLKCLDGTTHSIGFPITIWPFPTGFTSEAPRWFWGIPLVPRVPPTTAGFLMDFWNFMHAVAVTDMRFFYARQNLRSNEIQIDSGGMISSRTQTKQRISMNFLHSYRNQDILWMVRPFDSHKRMSL